MSEQLWGVLIGALSAIVGGLLASVVSHFLEMQREDRKAARERAKEERQRTIELVESAKEQMIGERILRAEIEA